MKGLVRKLSRPENVVINICSGTCFTAKACILPDQHRTFVECNVDSALLTAAEADHVAISVLQVLSPKSDSSNRSKVAAA